MGLNELSEEFERARRAMKSKKFGPDQESVPASVSPQWTIYERRF
jgi:hypothetical protein